MSAKKTAKKITKRIAFGIHKGKAIEVTRKKCQEGYSIVRLIEEGTELAIPNLLIQ